MEEEGLKSAIIFGGKNCTHTNKTKLQKQSYIHSLVPHTNPPPTSLLNLSQCLTIYVNYTTTEDDGLYRSATEAAAATLQTKIRYVCMYNYPLKHTKSAVKRAIGPSSVVILHRAIDEGGRK